MSQGYPLQKEELQFIWNTRKQWPSLVARHLSVNYSHLNGGSRGKKTVAEIQGEMIKYSTFKEWWKSHFNAIKEEGHQEETPQVKIPDLRKGSRKKKVPA